ncbi:MAG: hypothetical protein SGPRY_008322, partial [Prymnesium sp.]
MSRLAPLFVPFGLEVGPSAAAMLRLGEELSALVATAASLRPDEARALSIGATLAKLERMWQANTHALRALLPSEIGNTLSLPSPLDVNTSMPPLPLSSPAYAGAAQLLAHVSRDWSPLGRASRASTHTRVLSALRRLRRPARVLLPGAGACRLAWEVARRGHRVEANDEAVEMLLAGRSVMAWEGAPLTIFPHARCEMGAMRREACEVGTVVPDVTLGPTPANLTLQLGDFSRVYSDASQLAAWDAVVTCYFIDTLAEPVAAIRRISEVLTAGGRWINIGPLHWHNHKTGLLRLSYAEMLKLMQLHGFVIETSRRVNKVPYLGVGNGILGSSS